MKASGKGIPADEVFAYLEARGLRPKDKATGRPTAAMIAFDTGALEDGEFAQHQVRLIKLGVLILNDFPRIGRKVPRSQLRELVTEYDEFDRRVRIVAIRHQRERGYAR